MKLRFIRDWLFARPGRGLGVFFIEPGSRAETVLGLTAARAAFVSLCLVDIPADGTFFTGLNVAALSVIEVFVVGRVEDFFFSGSKVECDCCGHCLKSATSGEDGEECCNGESALGCGWNCTSDVYFVFFKYKKTRLTKGSGFLRSPAADSSSGLASCTSVISSSESTILLFLLDGSLILRDCCSGTPSSEELSLIAS